MSNVTTDAATPDAADPYAPVPVELKNPVVAAWLAWFWPGAGHLYQQRYGKGLLFMSCILITYFAGFAVGDGHVVYASFHRPDFRYPYILQIGVGLPALPAMFRHPTATPAELRSRPEAERPDLDGPHGWMAPPAHYQEHGHDQLAYWHERSGYFFELGTLYTMVAGLLNVLAIYDAYAGPVFMPPNPKKHQKKKDKTATSEDTGSPPPTPEPSDAQATGAPQA